MPIELDRLQATCYDCNQEFTGSLSISVHDPKYGASVAEVRGDLAYLCAKHHQLTPRKYTAAHNHAFFSVHQDQMYLGRMGVRAALNEPNAWQLFYPDQEGKLAEDSGRELSSDVNNLFH